MPLSERISSKFHIDVDKCTACYACELACNHHHSGRFGTVNSSVHIDYDPKTSNIQIDLDDTCDYCRNEEIALCMSFCVPGAIRVEPV